MGRFIDRLSIWSLSSSLTERDEMINLLAIITSAFIYVLQAALIFTASLILYLIVGKSAGLAGWVAYAHLALTAFIASGASGYSAVSITRDLFPAVAPRVIVFGVSTLMLGSFLVWLLAWISTNVAPFESPIQGVLFVVNVGAALVGVRLAYRKISP
jgi:hypothetical protein